MYVSEWKGSHAHTSGLKLYRISTQETKVLICDVEKRDEQGNPILAFYSQQGESNEYHWIDHENLLIPSTEKGNTVLNKINAATNDRGVYKMVFDFNIESVQILSYDFNGGLIFRKTNFCHHSTIGYIKDISKCFENGGKDVEIIYEQVRKDIKPLSFIEHRSLFEQRVAHDEAPEVEGFLWGLKEFKGKRLYERPALLILHGGPHSVRNNVYDPMHTILLQQGFLILIINYSGTWSYGSDFNEKINGDLGGNDVREVVNIVKML
jgi:Prolyl oligopeptidase family